MAQPLTIRGAKIGVIFHWRNEAAKRKCEGDMARANSRQINRVPIYFGQSAQLVKSLRAKNYRRAA